MDEQQEFLKRLNGILANLERIYEGEQPGDIGPEYGLTSYAAGYTFTSVAYETDGLFVCVWHDPDDDVMYGELRKEGWPDIKVDAVWLDEGDELAVTGKLFREAWKRTLPEQDS